MALELGAGLTLYLARHGQTELNVEDRFSGKLDTALTALGLKQAACVGTILLRELGPRPPIAFVASPLQRARTSMEIVRAELGLPREGYATDARLEEINLGKWDTLSNQEARALDPAAFDARMADRWNVRVPGGENYADVAARAADWLRSLRADTFAVSHGAFSRNLRGQLAGLDWRGMAALDEPQGVVFRVRGSDVVRLDP
jgi:broad specificity phosphatase PhoE